MTNGIGEGARAGAPLTRDPPLIVTLKLDEASSQFFDRERAQHFPPERNFLSAHITLFHALPGELAPEICAALREAAVGQPPFPLRVTGLRMLGRGVAYKLAAPELMRLHAALLLRFRAVLTPQDRQKLDPHVTVQNKVAPSEARALFDRLQARFTPWEAQAEGLLLWAYRGGPWDAVAGFPFAGHLSTA